MKCINDAEKDFHQVLYDENFQDRVCVVNWSPGVEMIFYSAICAIEIHTDSFIMKFAVME